MRDFTKSMMSYAWAMSMLGVQQMLNLLTPDQNGDQTRRATETFEDITAATTDTFDRAVRATFQAGDNIQRGLVDVFFGGCLTAGWDANRWARTGSDAFNQAREWTRRGAQTAGDYARYAAGAAPGCCGDQSGAGGTGGNRNERAGARRPAGDWGPIPR